MLCSEDENMQCVAALISLFCVLGAANVVDDSDNRTRNHFTIEQLLSTTFPKKTSDDLDLDPCKAGE